MTIGAGWDIVGEILTVFTRMAEEHGGEACGVVGAHVVRGPVDPAPNSS